MKVAIVDNLRSVYNVGSIFRTANAVGIEKLYLCGTTPTPLDKWGGKRSDFAKVALGAEEKVAWEYVSSTVDCLEKLKTEGMYVVAIEQDEKAIDYKQVNVDDKKDVAFIIGPEVDGMSGEVLSLCDVIAEIPMLGTKESLNVSVSVGITLFAILNK